MRDGVGLAPVQAEGAVGTLLTLIHLEQWERADAIYQARAVPHVDECHVKLLLALLAEAFLAPLTLK